MGTISKWRGALTARTLEWSWAGRGDKPTECSCKTLGNQLNQKAHKFYLNSLKL